MISIPTDIKDIGKIARDFVEKNIKNIIKEYGEREDFNIDLIRTKFEDHIIEVFKRVEKKITFNTNDINSDIKMEKYIHDLNNYYMLEILILCIDKIGF